MPLRPWQALPIGGTVVPDPDARPRTGGWRTGVRPEVDLSKCVDCLLCWVYCPDSSIRTEDGTFLGIDLEHCKGCEICAVVCPTGAIEMVADDD
jgi:2-oxoacid:acceptor oxidoreductase delta subunit (pyruvate/2-ketoisovalerate family)